MIQKTIVFDLDDTLIPEIDYLQSAFREIAEYVDAENKNLYDEMYKWYQNKENVFCIFKNVDGPGINSFWGYKTILGMAVANK